MHNIGFSLKTAKFDAMDQILVKVFFVYGEVRLHLDEDNALVASYDEDETSQTPTSSSDGSKDDDIDLENDSFDT